MLRTGQLLGPASNPASRPRTGALLPGTLASPRTGLTPAGCPQLVDWLRHHSMNLLVVMTPNLLDALPVRRPGATGSTARVAFAIPVAKVGQRCDNRHVPVEGHQYGERVWFHDARGQVRRMGVSTHPADSTMVISLWQGDVCTGTFRLPAKDAARLISTLAYGMTEAIPGERPPDSEVGLGRLRQIWSRIFRRVFVPSPGTTETELRLLK